MCVCVCVCVHMCGGLWMGRNLFVVLCSFRICFSVSSLNYTHTLICSRFSRPRASDIRLDRSTGRTFFHDLASRMTDHLSSLGSIIPFMLGFFGRFVHVSVCLCEMVRVISSDGSPSAIAGPSAQELQQIHELISYQPEPEPSSYASIHSFAFTIFSLALLR